MKKISVIIPCYNAEAYVDRCMTCLINQTIGIDALEIILVNDASTDDTLECLLAYESRYPETVMVINCEENHKQGAARNIGLEYASGKYIGYVDIDDWCDLDMFEILYNVAETFHTDVVTFDYLRDDGTKGMNYAQGRVYENIRYKYLELSTKEEKETMLGLSGRLGMAAWSKFCRKDFLIEHDIYFMEDIFYEDNLWSALLFSYVGKVVMLDEKMYHYFSNIHSTTATRDITKHFDLFKVCLRVWQEYDERGIHVLYPEAAEYNFLWIFYLQGIKMILNQNHVNLYETFQYMVKVVNQLVPNWKTNRYIKSYTAENLLEAFDMINSVTTEEEYQERIAKIDL